MQRVTTATDVYDDRTFALREAAVRNEAVATVLAHDVLDHGEVDQETALWAIWMTDQIGRWLEIAKAA
jgi:hypothetical protein